MGERRAGYRYLWVAYSREVVVLWEQVHRPDDSRGRTMLALHIYGQVLTSTQLRAIPLRTIYGADPHDYPCWVVKLGPDGWTAVLEPVASGAEGWIGPESPEYGGLDWGEAPTPTNSEVFDAWESWAGPDRDQPVDFHGRLPDETPDDFYARVGAAYRLLAQSTGKPTTDLARLASVAKPTAANWVREARKRGHLEQTTRGKVNR